MGIDRAGRGLDPVGFGQDRVADALETKPGGKISRRGPAGFASIAACYASAGLDWSWM